MCSLSDYVFGESTGTHDRRRTADRPRTYGVGGQTACRSGDGDVLVADGRIQVVVGLLNDDKKVNRSGGGLHVLARETS